MAHLSRKESPCFEVVLRWFEIQCSTFYFVENKGRAGPELILSQLCLNMRDVEYDRA